MTNSPELISPPQDRYPALFAPQRWEWGGIDAQFSLAMPPDGLITNIHLIGFIGDQVVVCEDNRGHWFLPGGTREADETVRDCLVRELREEAGARLCGEPAWIGAHLAVTDRPAPTDRGSRTRRRPGSGAGPRWSWTARRPTRTTANRSSRSGPCRSPRPPR